LPFSADRRSNINCTNGVAGVTDRTRLP
jgi:hypothetical protein